jgi:predicted phage terminase large subunit-like protein
VAVINPLVNLTEIDIADRILAERRLIDFMRFGWHVLEDRPFQENWHLHGMCECLEAVELGQIKRLAICIPPGLAKSRTVCVFYFGWAWQKNPALRFLYTSYSSDFAQRDSIASRDLIRSDWYQQKWGGRFYMREDQDAKSHFANNRGGFRVASSVSGMGAGVRVDRGIADDALKIEEGTSKLARDRVNHFWDYTMCPGRAADPATAAFIIVQQRLDKDDLVGHVLKTGGYECFFVPMEYESAHRCTTVLGCYDPRTQDGELAFPERFDRAFVDDWKKRLRGSGTAALLQQRPNPHGEGEAIFDPQNFRYFTEEMVKTGNGETEFEEAFFVLHRGEGVDSRFRVRDCKFFQTCDTAMKTGQQHDFTVVGTFALTPEHDLLVYDIARAKIAMPAQYEFVLGMRRKFPQVLFQAIEDKVSGTGIIQEGQIRGTPFRTLKADGDKERRASEVATMYLNRKVFHKSGANWLADFEDEIGTFPASDFMDQTDVVAYAGILARTDAVLRGAIERAAAIKPIINTKSRRGGETYRIGGVDVNFPD